MEPLSIELTKEEARCILVNMQFVQIIRPIIRDLPVEIVNQVNALEPVGLITSYALRTKLEQALNN